MNKKFCLMAVVTLVAALNSPAASGNWTNNAASIWSAATNWNSNPTVPGTAAGDTVGLTFDITAARTVTIDTTSRTVGVLNIGDPGSSYFAYTLAASGGATLTFNNNGGGALLAKPTAANTALDVISAPITLADNLTIDTAVTGTGNSGLSLQITSVIGESGARTLTKNGVGGVRLDGANSYTGGAILNAGEVQMGSSYVFGYGPLTINGGSLASRTASRTITNDVTVNGDFTCNSANAGGNALTLSGNVNLGSATRTITVASTANPSAFITGIISGGNPGVGLIKAGGSTFNISGANTYSGDTRIVAGSLQLSPSTGAPSGTSLALQNSTLDMNAADAGNLGFRGSVGTVAATLGGLKGSRNVNLQNTSSPAVGVALTVGNNGQSTTYSGALSGAGGSLTKIGAGTLVLSGANTYDGATTISGGSLQLGEGGASGSLSASGYIQNDGNLTVNRNNTAVQGVDFGGGYIAGSGSFTQAGSGTTILNMANSYTGPTTVSAGRLVVSSEQSGTGAATVADGAALGVTASNGQWQPVALTLGASAGCVLEFNNVAGPGTTFAPLNPGSVTRNAAVTVNVRSISGAITVGGSGYPLLGNMSGSTAGYTLGIQPPGVSGHLAVSGSTLTYVVDSLSDIWVSGDSTNPTFWDIGTSANWAGNAVNNTPANTFAQNDNVLFNDTVTGLQAVTVTAAVTPGVVSVDNAGTEYNIVSSGGSIGGNGGLNKSGAGTLSVAGPNTYSGGTTLTAGRLNINDGGTSTANSAIGTGPLTINGGTLGNAGPGDVTLLPNNAQYWNGDFSFAGAGYNLNLGTGTVTPNNSRSINVSGNTLTVGGVIGGGTISLTKTGNGALTLSGANTFSGGMILSAGQLNINNGSSIGTGTLTVNGGTIDNTSGADVTLLPNNAQVWNGSFTYAGTANSLNLGTGPVTMPVACTVTVDGNTLTVGGVITGAAGLTKLGAGTLALLSANNYGNNGAYDTALNGGTLVLGNDLALGTSRLNFADGVTIQSSDSSARVISNRLNFGSGAGGNTIFAGTGNLTFTGSAANSSSKILTVNNPVTEFSGVLSGTMARTFAGTGKLILSGANTWSLGSTINPGATLQLGNGGTNGSLSTSGAILNDGTLIFDRSNALVQGVHFSAAPITGSGSVVQAGSGTTTLNAANTYTGPTTVNNGELFITPAYQGGGNVIVANGASFGVSANSASNSATIGSLTLGSGGATMLDFSYGLAGNPTNAILVAGAVTINGASSVRISGSFAVGTFPLLRYSSLSGAFASTVAGPRGVTATLVNDVANRVLYVTVSTVGSGIVWTGTNNISPNLWDLNTTANWLIGGQETVYMEQVPPGDEVTFNDLGSGVVLLNNTVSPASVTINNVSVDYTFQGSGQINSTAGLTKVGAGTVTMNVPGTFAGSTILSNGTFSIGASQSLANLSGDSAVTVSTGTPTLTLNNGLNTTYSGNVAGALTLTKSGGSVLTMTGSNSFTGNLFVKAGGLTLDSGFMGVNSFCSIGLNGADNGTLTLRATANLTGNNDFNVGDVGASVGTLNIQDTASLTVNAFYIGSANAAGSTASGTVNQTGGTVTQVSSATGLFAVGGRVDTTSIGGVGVYNMSGGVLSAATAMRIGGGGAGTFNQSGGTVNAGVDVNLARFAGSAGTYNLNGGTLRTARVTSSTGINATFNMNGGVLLAREDNTSIITNLSVVLVRDGGAVVDTTNFNVSVSSALQHSYLQGDNAVDGGLTKRGNGTLTLAESYSSYTGPTIVMGGALNLSPASVASLNSLTLSNGALGLAMSGGTVTYSATDLKLAGNAALNLNYDLVSGTPIAAINASGSLTASGTTTINVFGHGWTVGQFTLVDYAGAPLANLNNFRLGALPYGVTASLYNNAANTSIDLVVTAVGLTTWIPLAATDVAGTSSFAAVGNWQDVNPPTAGNGYFTRMFALRSPADNGAYSFAGSALVVDSGGRFIMKGTNGQTMTVNNLVLNGGLVDYANAGDNFTETLAGNITLQGGMTSYLGALGSAGASETLFVTAPVGGSGDLQLGGPNVNGGADVGVVVLAATNTYTGATTVAGGTLLVNGAIDNSAITVNANARLGGTGFITGPVTVQTGGNLAPGIPARGALTAAIGTLSIGGAPTIDGTVSMKIDRAAIPSSDRLNAPAVVINPGATLAVSNLGSTNLAAGDTFTLFSAPVSGSFTTVNLPPLPSPDLYWTNRLAVNGTIAVASVVTVNTTSTNITATVTGNTLTLSWPADHLGWHLQAQTNSVSAGLGANWVTVPGSDTVTTINVTIDPAAGSVFYRMVYP